MQSLSEYHRRRASQKTCCMLEIEEKRKIFREVGLATMSDRTSNAIEFRPHRVRSRLAEVVDVGGWPRTPSSEQVHLPDNLSCQGVSRVRRLRIMSEQGLDDGEEANIAKRRMAFEF